MGNQNSRHIGTSTPRTNPSTPTSATHTSRTFDGGSLAPNGIYPTPPDYNPTHLLKYIRTRKLAPFYKGLDDYEDDWTDYQLSVMVRDGTLPATAFEPIPEGGRVSNSSSPTLVLSPTDEAHKLLRAPSPRQRGMSGSVIEPDTATATRFRPRAQTISSPNLIPTHNRPLEAILYRNAIECPLCFLVFSPNSF
jgi:hypothetical protein